MAAWMGLRAIGWGERHANANISTVACIATDWGEGHANVSPSDHPKTPKIHT